ncbi:hypothetical protein SIN8267_01037 [Sinobacterium norvegicum]|uniref:HNH endonuclease n=1 Tax=Sinobacterium norvegicum TaxID=1641715 RepID=A0ABM9ACN1_9GAMM|nr:hypothetical protein [Sinobacterium norvegicum]CAH0990936.1 hypothetical protein SIN8267_01037 [Sinobacterium norvegicum]
MADEYNPLSRYQRLRAIDAEFYHRCYYCGDIANTEDYIPPLARARTPGSYPNAQFFISPSCSECKTLGGINPHVSIEQRAKYIRQALKKKYAATYKKTMLWSREEVETMIADDGMTNITRSLKAVIDMEEDLHGRLHFTGFPLEVNGSRYYNPAESPGDITVFGQRFSSRKLALHSLAQQYSCKVEKLLSLVEDYKGDFEAAVQDLLKQQQQSIQQRQIRQQAEHLHQRYNQPTQWLQRSLSSLWQQHPEHSIEQISQQLVERYINR